VGQLPYNPLLKATLISSSLYDNQKIHLFLCINVMNIVSLHESRQRKKINYSRSTYSLSLRIMGSESNLR